MYAIKDLLEKNIFSKDNATIFDPEIEMLLCDFGGPSTGIDQQEIMAHRALLAVKQKLFQLTQTYLLIPVQNKDLNNVFQLPSPELTLTVREPNITKSFLDLSNQFRDLRLLSLKEVKKTKKDILFGEDWSGTKKPPLLIEDLTYYYLYPRSIVNNLAMAARILYSDHQFSFKSLSTVGYFNPANATGYFNPLFR